MKNNLVYNVREVITIRELIESSCEMFADKCAFTFADDDDVITEISYARFFEELVALSAYLNSLGLEGKKIAVTGRNSYNWALTYAAITCGCGIVVPLDKDLPIKDSEFILGDSESSAVMISDELEEKFENMNICRKLHMSSMREYIERGKELISMGDRSYADHRIAPDALGVLLYTSGTTGVAKGVMLSQRNICWDIVHVLKNVTLKSTDLSLSVLPLHHTYECTAGFLGMVYVGGTIAYNRSLRKLRADLQLFKPTVLIAVPMILESFLKVVENKYGAIKGGMAIFSVQKKAAKLAPRGSDARKKLFSSVNEAFGGRLRMVLSGAALLAPEVFSAYESFGIDLYIGYGLTETSPIAVLHNDFYRDGNDVGYPIIGGMAKISDPDEEGKGELCVKGKHVMLGYYKNPEETEKVLKDGWFHTGDLAKMRENGAIQIVGRLKSMIVAKNGKKIFPEEIEFKLSKSKLISECLVFGSGEDLNDPIVTASIYPNNDEISRILSAKGIPEGTKEWDDAVTDLFEKLVMDVNRDEPAYKYVKKVIIRKTEFEKTTTRKIKRNSSENFKDE